MSFNRLAYDHCRYSRELNENTNVLKYIINENRYEHPNKCRHELGVLGGATVSQVRGNVVDLESELRGITRNLSMCAVSQAKPLDEQPIILNDKTKPIDTRKAHLPSCQMIDYPAVPLPGAQRFNSCKR
jgi:hypothetical protein